MALIDANLTLHHQPHSPPFRNIGVQIQLGSLQFQGKSVRKLSAHSRRR